MSTIINKKANKKAGKALFRQISKAAEMAEALNTRAGQDAAKALCDVQSELILAVMGGFNDE